MFHRDLCRFVQSGRGYGEIEWFFRRSLKINVDGLSDVYGGIGWRSNSD